MRRIGWIAQNTLREASRQKALAWCSVVALGVSASAGWFSRFDLEGAAATFVIDFGVGTMAFFGAALAIAATAQLFFSELDRGSVLTLLAKPVRRSEFVLGKLIALIALLTGFCLAVGAATAVAVSLGTDSSTATHAGYLRLASATFLQWVKLGLVAAFSLLIATYARSALFTMTTAVLWLAICQLQHLVHETYAQAASAPVRAAAALTSWLFPNFEVFAVENVSARGDGSGAMPLGGLAVYAAIYAAVAVALSVFSFQRREL